MYKIREYMLPAKKIVGLITFYNAPVVSRHILQGTYQIIVYTTSWKSSLHLVRLHAFHEVSLYTRGQHKLRKHVRYAILG